MLGIIGAMEIEVATLIDAMEISKKETKAGMTFCCGKIEGKDVVVVKSGVGKVNAAMCTQILIDDFDVDAVVNTGVAGSLNNDIDICDVVVSTKAQQHDMDVTALGYDRGIIPDMEKSVFEADSKLIDLAKKSAKDAGLEINVFEGKVLSGDQFIGTEEAKNFLKKEFAGDCAEMEGASIAQSAYLNHIPFVIIRAISDKADGSAEVDYPVFEEAAARHSARLVADLVKRI